MSDWKTIAQSEGYKSLKQAMVNDIQNNHRSKEESHKKFNWVIGRAKHYAHHTGKDVEEILNEWESKRKYWWLNYYQNSNQPRFVTKARTPMGLRGEIKRVRESRWSSKRFKKRRVCELIAIYQKSEKSLSRWPKSRKMRNL